MSPPITVHWPPAGPGLSAGEVGSIDHPEELLSTAVYHRGVHPSETVFRRDGSEDSRWTAQSKEGVEEERCSKEEIMSERFCLKAWKIQ